MTLSALRKYLSVGLRAAILGACFAGPTAQASPRARLSSTSPKKIAAPQTTRLRASNPVVVYSRKRGHQTIEHLNVSVSNVGLGVATHVDVTAEFPDGIIYPLKGPRTIAPGQRCLYSLGGKKTVLRSGSPKVVTSCGSCVR